MNDKATEGSVLGTGGMVFIGLYCLTLLVIGWLGHRAKKENSLADFYLGGSGFGFFVLLLTLYATQYSGNTLLGFAGTGYRNGFRYLAIVLGMMSIIGVYFIYAPKLRRLSEKRGYITMGDYLMDRFQLRSLAVAGVIVGIVGLCNYILTNLIALGKLVVWLSGGEIGFATGVIVLAIIMVIYEYLGGMRSVAWTDMLQGSILLVGVVLIFSAIFIHYDGVEGLVAGLQEHKPEALAPPSGAEARAWWDKVVLFGLGISMYPHAIQRIYAAKSEKVLKRSLQVMVFLPLVTTLFMVLLGIMGSGRFPGLDKIESDRITLHMLQDLKETQPNAQFLVIIFIAAIVAATMSTIDSALLAISSIFTRDLYQPLNPAASQQKLTLIGKGASVVLMAATVCLAIWLRESQTLWSLIKIKLELLCQIAPAFLLGLHWKNLDGRAVLAGLLAGTTVAIVLKFWPAQFIVESGISAGIWGLGLNLIVLITVQTMRRTKSK
jgi:SSS family solute:Na+ symporter